MTTCRQPTERRSDFTLRFLKEDKENMDVSDIKRLTDAPECLVSHWPEAASPDPLTSLQLFEEVEEEVQTDVVLFASSNLSAPMSDSGPERCVQGRSDQRTTKSRRSRLVSQSRIFITASRHKMNQRQAVLF